jgi:hypothetical protein
VTVIGAGDTLYTQGAPLDVQTIPHVSADQWLAVTYPLAVGVGAVFNPSIRDPSSILASLDRSAHRS